LLTYPALICLDGKSAMKAPDIKGKTTKPQTMSRNFLYLILGALAVMAVFGFQTYWERQNTADIGINVGVRSNSIEKK
jgi:hypothetical protein